MRSGCWGLVAFLLAACAAGGAPPAAPEAGVAPGTMVPFGAAPQVDGKVTPDEWREAQRVEVGAGAHLYLMHDGAHVYLAVAQVPAHGFGLACVFIAEADRVHVLHASAQLGSAVYVPSGGERFDPRSKQYAWKPPADILREEGWMASSVGKGSDGSAHEFRIALARLGLGPGATTTSLPIAVGYSYLNSDTDRNDNQMSGLLTWPSRTGDAIAEVRLLGGWNPDQVRFAPERWARLTLAPARR